MSDATYRVYAVQGTVLEAEAGRLAAALGAGEQHESDYLGGDYYLWRVTGGEVRLLPNRQGPDEDETYVPETGVALVVDVSVRDGADPIEPLVESLGYSRLR